jgi:hypothetical protein
VCYLSLLLLASAVFPLLVSAQADVASASWMAGCWVAGSGASQSDEVWMVPHGGMMVGITRTVRGGVARGFELAVLHNKDGNLIFTAYPSVQTPADFQATKVSHEVLRVENAQHDFPQAIECVPTPPDSLIAHVYGDVAASTPAFSLRYRRHSC